MKIYKSTKSRKKCRRVSQKTRKNRKRIVKRERSRSNSRRLKGPAGRSRKSQKTRKNRKRAFIRGGSNARERHSAAAPATPDFRPPENLEALLVELEQSGQEELLLLRRDTIVAVAVAADIIDPANAVAIAKELLATIAAAKAKELRSTIAAPQQHQLDGRRLRGTRVSVLWNNEALGGTVAGISDDGDVIIEFDNDR